MEKKDYKSIMNHGVNFIHDRGSFALVNERGNIVSDFDLSSEQICAINKYLEQGVYRGMFDILDRSVYRTALALKYDALRAKVGSVREKQALIEDFRDKLNEIDTYQKGRSLLFRESDEGWKQPE